MPRKTKPKPEVPPGVLEFGDRQVIEAAPAPTTPELPRPQIPAGGASQQALAVTPLHAPTAAPDEPVTAGVNFGAGPGREALGHDEDLSSWLPLLDQLAAYPGAHPELIALAQLARSRFGG